MNPYEVLGVSPDADEETIKKAYRELVKKYHPDKYVNNPLADLAGEKIKEINKAYDMIMNKSSSASSSHTASQSSYNPAGSYSISFQSVRMLISSGRVVEAQTMLNSLPRTAEWYYLTGVIHLRRGWYNSAIENLRRAVQMDPDNAEYQEALNNINSRSTQYTRTSTSGNDCCCPCGTLICLDCCCC